MTTNNTLQKLIEESGKAFDEKFVNKLYAVNVEAEVWKNLGVVGDYVGPKEIKSFLSSELTRAYKAGLEEGKENKKNEASTLIEEIEYNFGHFGLTRTITEKINEIIRAINKLKEGR